MNITPNEKEAREYVAKTGPCESYVTINHQYNRCSNKGHGRIHNQLRAGIHCDPCWNKLLTEYRTGNR